MPSPPPSPIISLSPLLGRDNIRSAWLGAQAPTCTFITTRCLHLLYHLLGVHNPNHRHQELAFLSCLMDAISTAFPSPTLQPSLYIPTPVTIGDVIPVVDAGLKPLVLRRLGSIFTSVYAAVHKLKKAFGKSFSSAWLTIPS
ncbi:hypothetical protein Tco_0080428 [Tanacetum coccineum]